MKGRRGEVEMRRKGSKGDRMKSEGTGWRLKKTRMGCSGLD
jgi:hypothetical protein